MSYLDLPRFHLFGQFFANPSTINNEAVNYNLEQPYNSGPGYLPGAVGWNPPGQALWTMKLGVRTLLGADGDRVSSGDALAGATLASVDMPYKAKLVDLDPQQQVFSQVWGLTVSLTLADDTVAFTGTVAECALTDVWGRVTGGSGGGIETASGAFQTVVQVTEWGDLSASPVLQALQAAAGDTLSLKWVVDGYNGQFGTSNFGWGRMVATIGPQYPGEPVRFLAKRRLDNPRGSMWMAPFQVDDTRSVLTLDLGNSVSTTALYGGPFALDAVTVALNNGAEAMDVSLAYDETTYQDTAGIYDVPLTPEQLALARTSPVTVAGTGASGGTGSLAEMADGRYVNVDPSFLRLDPGETGTVQLYARQWGQPVDGAFPLALTQIGNSDNTGQPTFVGGTDPAGLPLPAPVETQGGTAAVTLTGGTNPPNGPDRTDVDGQVYNVVGPWWSPNMLCAGLPALSVLVFDAFTPASDPPTWWGDIQPFMYQYARMYPGMRDILDISDYGTMTRPVMGSTTGAELVNQVLQLPRTDPNHMPVTRDLSGGRRAAYAAWVAGGCPEGTQPADFQPRGAPRTPSPPEPASEAHGSVKSALVQD